MSRFQPLGTPDSTRTDLSFTTPLPRTEGLQAGRRSTSVTDILSGLSGALDNYTRGKERAEAKQERLDAKAEQALNDSAQEEILNAKAAYTLARSNYAASVARGDPEEVQTRLRTAYEETALSTVDAMRFLSSDESLSVRVRDTALGFATSTEGDHTGLLDNQRRLSEAEDEVLLNKEIAERIAISTAYLNSPELLDTLKTVSALSRNAGLGTVDIATSNLNYIRSAFEETLVGMDDEQIAEVMNHPTVATYLNRTAVNMTQAISAAELTEAKNASKEAKASRIANFTDEAFIAFNSGEFQRFNELADFLKEDGQEYEETVTNAMNSLLESVERGERPITPEGLLKYQDYISIGSTNDTRFRNAVMAAYEDTVSAIKNNGGSFGHEEAVAYELGLLKRLKSKYNLSDGSEPLSPSMTPAERALISRLTRPDIGTISDFSFSESPFVSRNKNLDQAKRDRDFEAQREIAVLTTNERVGLEENYSTEDLVKRIGEAKDSLLSGDFYATEAARNYILASSSRLPVLLSSITNSDEKARVLTILSTRETDEQAAEPGSYLVSIEDSLRRAKALVTDDVYATALKDVAEKYDLTIKNTNSKNDFTVNDPLLKESFLAFVAKDYAASPLNKKSVKELAKTYSKHVIRDAKTGLYIYIDPESSFIPVDPNAFKDQVVSAIHRGSGQRFAYVVNAVGEEEGWAFLESDPYMDSFKESPFYASLEKTSKDVGYANGKTVVSYNPSRADRAQGFLAYNLSKNDDFYNQFTSQIPEGFSDEEKMGLLYDLVKHVKDWEYGWTGIRNGNEIAITAGDPSNPINIILNEDAIRALRLGIKYNAPRYER